MEPLVMKIKNPFALLSSLQVALEVAWPDMSPEQLKHLRRFTETIPTQIGPAPLAVCAAERESLLACASCFRRSRTWYWLREDLSEAVVELERELCRGKS